MLKLFWACRIRLRQKYLCVVEEELKSGWQRAISNSSLFGGWNDIRDGGRSGAKRDPEATKSLVPKVSEHLMLVLRVEMVDGVEPFAHGHTLDKLRLNLVTIEGHAQDSANSKVEGSGHGPAWKKSLSGDASEIAFLDIEKVAHREQSAGEVGALSDTLSVIQASDYGLVFLPLVGIHVSNF